MKMSKNEIYSRAVKALDKIIDGMNDLLETYFLESEPDDLMNDVPNYPFIESLDEQICLVEIFQETIEKMIEK